MLLILRLILLDTNFQQAPHQLVVLGWDCGLSRGSLELPGAHCRESQGSARTRETKHQWGRVCAGNGGQVPQDLGY